jgi:hypothetical protein
LEAFVDRPEFTAGNAQISQNGLKAQEPVLQSALQVSHFKYTEWH